jgi:hypothetical protein
MVSARMLVPVVQGLKWRRTSDPVNWLQAEQTGGCAIVKDHFGGVMDSTTVTKPAVHAVMAANHVNPKL